MFSVSTSKMAALRPLMAVGLLTAMACSTPVLAQNSSISLDLNDDAVRLSWNQIRPERQIGYGASAFNHQDRGNIFSGDFHITGNAATKARPINAGLGGRVVLARAEEGPELENPVIVDPVPGSTDFPSTAELIALGAIRRPSRNGYALAVGGFFDGKIPNYDRIGFGGHLYYSPEVLAFGEMEEFTDVWLYASYSVLRNGDVYLGARALKADFKDIGDYKFDTGVHVGFKLKF
ncbi:MAG: YfaZ family outer membrane protein [Gammaproteobacteria bacterium]